MKLWWRDVFLIVCLQKSRGSWIFHCNELEQIFFKTKRLKEEKVYLRHLSCLPTQTCGAKARRRKRVPGVDYHRILARWPTIEWREINLLVCQGPRFWDVKITMSKDTQACTGLKRADLEGGTFLWVNTHPSILAETWVYGVILLLIKAFPWQPYLLIGNNLSVWSSPLGGAATARRR